MLLRDGGFEMFEMVIYMVALPGRPAESTLVV
jgi:hypothetical protein